MTRSALFGSALIGAALLLTNTMAGAQELYGTIKKIKDSVTIVIGHNEDSPPFAYFGADGKPQGYSIDICNKIAEAVKARGLDSVGFIAPSFAMSRDFFTARIAAHGITVHVPDVAHHEAVNRIVYDELVHGKVLNASRRTIVGLVDELWDAGAKGLVLGTTELELLVKQADVELPLFPATTLHVDAALARALA